MTTAIFTVVSANYVAFAATLMQSLRRFHPEIPRFVILCDEFPDLDGVDLAAELILCDELGIARIANMKLWYAMIEFNTAMKPFAFRHLFAERGFDAVIYLDPDIELYAPLEEVFEALRDNSLVLTPHLTKPLRDDQQPSDLSILKAGVYNLGFVAIKSDQDGRNLVSWWCDRLYAHCRVDVPGNMFTDQRWIDLAPGFVERTFLLRHPGYNAAYWNIMHRETTLDAAGSWRAGGRPLVFYHFSGLDPADPAMFSRHQTRFTMATIGELAKLCSAYAQRVLANGWLRFNGLPYAFATCADGWPISDSMRRYLLRELDAGRLRGDRPLRIVSSYFDESAEETFAEDGRLTRFAHQFWLARPDLQAAFGLQQRPGFDSYVAWFCDGTAEQEGVAARHVQAARALRDGEVEETSPFPAPPPWKPVASVCWHGPANRVDDWLSEDVDFTIDGIRYWMPRQAALLWESRRDLQRTFPLHSVGDVERFHLWCLTTAILEGNILPELFSANFMSWLGQPAPLGRIYRGVPITTGMALTRHVDRGRELLPVPTEFPLEETARLAQAFWFAYLAPRHFRWPAAITAPVRAWMNVPSDISIDGYELSRGALILHSLRGDLREAYDLATEAGRRRYLDWLLCQGSLEYGLGPLALCPGATAFLAQPSPRHPLLSRLVEMVYELRGDLRDAFDLTTDAGLEGLQSWVAGELRPWLESLGLQELIAENAAPVAPEPCCAALALSGDWSVPSGVGEELRTAVAALNATGFRDYVIIDMPTRRAMTPELEAIAPGRPLDVDCNVVFHNADTAMPDWLLLRAMGVRAGYTALHPMWELERLPAHWRSTLSFCDEIWAGSRFVERIFAAERARPVYFVGECVVAREMPGSMARRRFGLAEDATLFIFMFDFASYASRKNPHAVIRAFMQAFPAGTEPVQLFIKSQNAALRPDLWSELATLSDDKRIVIRDVVLSRDDVVSLVAAADAFVSLHRAEGFGRGPAEAMLLGVPVIVTGYSGTTDFTDAECACIVPYTMVPVAPGDYPAAEGQSWAEPDVAAAAAYMRWVHEEPASARAMGERGRRHAAAIFDPKTVGAALVARAQRSSPVRQPAVFANTG